MSDKISAQFLSLLRKENEMFLVSYKTVKHRNSGSHCYSIIHSIPFSFLSGLQNG